MFNRSLVIAIANNPTSPYAYDSILSVYDFVDEVLVADLGIDPALKERLSKLDKVVFKTYLEKVPFIEKIRSNLITQTKSDFVIYLDPDELFPLAVAKQLDEFQKSYDFISIPRKNIIFGKWMEHSRWWPDYQIRFFNKKNVQWKPILHAQPVAEGTSIALDPLDQNAILHYNYSSIDEYLAKSLRYAKSDAQTRVENGEDYSLKVATTTGLSEFMSRFFAGSGYKDGIHGFVLAFFQFVYYFIVYFYYWELKKYPPVPEKELVHTTNYIFSQGMYETSHWLSKLNLLSGLDKIGRKIVNRLIDLLR